MNLPLIMANSPQLKVRKRMWSKILTTLYKKPGCYGPASEGP